MTLQQFANITHYQMCYLWLLLCFGKDDDDNQNSIPDDLELDTDGDGIPDYLDDDDDNDGIPDAEGKIISGNWLGFLIIWK